MRDGLRVLTRLFAFATRWRAHTLQFSRRCTPVHSAQGPTSSRGDRARRRLSGGGAAHLRGGSARAAASVAASPLRASPTAPARNVAAILVHQPAQHARASSVGRLVFAAALHQRYAGGAARGGTTRGACPRGADSCTSARCFSALVYLDAICTRGRRARVSRGSERAARPRSTRRRTRRKLATRQAALLAGRTATRERARPAWGTGGAETLAEAGRAVVVPLFRPRLG